MKAVQLPDPQRNLLKQQLIGINAKTTPYPAARSILTHYSPGMATYAYRAIRLASFWHFYHLGKNNGLRGGNGKSHHLRQELSREFSNTLMSC